MIHLPKLSDASINKLMELATLDNDQIRVIGDKIIMRVLRNKEEFSDIAKEFYNHPDVSFNYVPLEQKHKRDHIIKFQSKISGDHVSICSESCGQWNLCKNRLEGRMDMRLRKVNEGYELRIGKIASFQYLDIVKDGYHWISGSPIITERLTDLYKRFEALPIKEMTQENCWDVFKVLCRHERTDGLGRSDGTIIGGDKDVADVLTKAGIKVPDAIKDKLNA